jgi:hypothetical protein
MDFKNLEDVTEDAVINLFADKSINELKSETPYCIVLVGAPGVGKTTKAREILRNMDMDYDTFFNISLDRIVERIKPYRNASKRLYNTIKSTKNLNDKNYGLLSELYLPTIMSHDIDFSLVATEKAKMKKIKGGVKKKRFTFKNLIGIRKEALKYAVLNGLNILYDTTLVTNKNKIGTEIMPIIELSPIKYKIIVILVTAPIEVIKNRIRERHKKMLTNSFIRAINPNLTEKFVKENEIGFENAKKYYNNSDITFIKVENLDVRSRRSTRHSTRHSTRRSISRSTKSVKSNKSNKNNKSTKSVKSAPN